MQNHKREENFYKIKTRDVKKHTKGKKTMQNILDKLSGGDLRSIGKADEVISDVLKTPTLFSEVFKGMKHTHPLIRMRSADIVEKISKMHPEYLKPHKEELINEIAEIEQQEVRWHVALMFTYIELSDMDILKVIEKLLLWLNNSKSKIVKVNSLEALAHIAAQDRSYKNKVLPILEEIAENSSPAMMARSKRLIDKLKKHN